MPVPLGNCENPFPSIAVILFFMKVAAVLPGRDHAYSCATSLSDVWVHKLRHLEVIASVRLRALPL